MLRKIERTTFEFEQALQNMLPAGFALACFVRGADHDLSQTLGDLWYHMRKLEWLWDSDQDFFVSYEYFLNYIWPITQKLGWAYPAIGVRNAWDGDADIDSDLFFTNVMEVYPRAILEMLIEVVDEK